MVVRHGETTALAGADLRLEPGTFTALLGPSGSGKSTALGVLAGLRTPSAGRVLLDGGDVSGVPPERRPVALVFQKPLLFPHLSVAQNVAFGLRMDGVGRREALRTAGEALERVRLAGLGGRRPDELSGGQEQRVALARALVRRPRLLLLDEPFSQLDPGLRAEVRGLVRELHDEAALTTLFVTHDREEAVEVADRVAVLLDGRVRATGTPRALWSSPPDLAVARFLGVGNEVVGEVRDGCFRGGGLRLPVGDGSGVGAAGAVGGPAPAGRAVLVARPERVVLGAAATARPGVVGEGAAAGPTVAARVTAVRFRGAHVVVVLRLPDGQVLHAHVPPGAEPAEGDTVPAGLAPGAATVLPEEPA